jgi:hypothetical protein
VAADMAADRDPAFDLPGFIDALGIVVAYGLAAADEAYQDGQRYPIHRDRSGAVSIYR